MLCRCSSQLFVLRPRRSAHPVHHLRGVVARGLGDEVVVGGCGDVEGVGWRWWMGLWLEVAGVLVVVVLVAGVGGGVVGWRDVRGGAGMAGKWLWWRWVRGCGEGRRWGGRAGGGRLGVVLVGGWMGRVRRARVGVWMGGRCVLVW